MYKNKSNSNRNIGVLSFLGIKNDLTLLLDQGVEVYSLDADKANPLFNAIGCAVLAKKNKDAKNDVMFKNSIEIFKLLLNYEAEERAYNPEKYKDIELLKDQKNKNDINSLDSASRNQEVLNALNLAIKEAEEYYKKCVEAKKKGKELPRYHKQFLSEIQESVAVEEPQTINASDTGLRKRNRSSSDENKSEESQPLLKEANNQKLSPKKEEGWKEWLSRNLLGNNTSNNITKVN